MTGVVIHVPQIRTDREVRREETRACEAKGRPGTRAPGGWIADLVALRKNVLLCDGCDAKWQPRRAGYRQQFVDPYVIGRCDGCMSSAFPVKSWIHEAVFDAIGQPKPARRGRWALRRDPGRQRPWFWF